MLVIADKLRSGAEKRVAGWLRRWEGDYRVPGVAIMNCYLAGQEVDLVVVTPYSTVVGEIKGVDPRVTGGVLQCTTNSPWRVPEFEGDPVGTRDDDTTPYDQVRDGVFKLKAAAGQLDGGGFVKGLVVVVPPRGTTLRLEKKSTPPQGCDVLLCGTQNPLRAWFHRAHHRSAVVWTAEQAYALVDALEYGGRTTVAALADEGFPLESALPAPSAAPGAPAPAPSVPEPETGAPAVRAPAAGAAPARSAAPASRAPTPNPISVPQTLVPIPNTAPTPPAPAHTPEPPGPPPPDRAPHRPDAAAPVRPLRGTSRAPAPDAAGPSDPVSPVPASPRDSAPAAPPGATGDSTGAPHGTDPGPDTPDRPTPGTTAESPEPHSADRRRAHYQTAAAFAVIAVLGAGLWLLGRSAGGDSAPGETNPPPQISSVAEQPAAPPPAVPPRAPAPAPPPARACFPFQPNC